MNRPNHTADKTTPNPAAAGQDAPHIMVGGRVVDLRVAGEEYATGPRSRGARWFTPWKRDDPVPLGELRLGVGTPSEFGAGPIVDLVACDPQWWDQIAAEAAKVAQSLRELTGDTQTPAGNGRADG
jgi:hypothetical protein